MRPEPVLPTSIHPTAIVEDGASIGPGTRVWHRAHVRRDARIGRPHCPVCGDLITRQTPQQIVDRILEMEEGTRFQVLAPVVRGRKGE